MMYQAAHVRQPRHGRENIAVDLPAELVAEIEAACLGAMHAWLQQHGIEERYTCTIAVHRTDQCRSPHSVTGHQSCPPGSLCREPKGVQDVVRASLGPVRPHDYEPDPDGRGCRFCGLDERNPVHVAGAGPL